MKAKGLLINKCIQLLTVHALSAEVKESTGQHEEHEDVKDIAVARVSLFFLHPFK